MNKAIIMEVTSRHWIVMTAGGQFKKVAINNADRTIGDEIQLSQTSYLRKRNIISAAIACMVLCFIVVSGVSGGLFSKSNVVAAYVSIDVNPSIELGIDHNARVLEATGINEEGWQLLETVGDLKGLLADEAAKVIFQSAMITDLLRPYMEDGGGNIVISSTVVTDHVGKFDEAVITKNMMLEIQEVFASEEAALNGKVAVTNLYTPRELREEARKHGVSAGKVAIKLLSIEQGQQLEWEDLQNKAIAQIAEELGGWDELIASEQDVTKDKLRELYNLQLQTVQMSNDVQTSNSDQQAAENQEQQPPKTKQDEAELKLKSSNRNNMSSFPAFVRQSIAEDKDLNQGHLQAWVRDDHPGHGYGLLKNNLEKVDEWIQNSWEDRGNRVENDSRVDNFRESAGDRSKENDKRKGNDKPKENDKQKENEKRKESNGRKVNNEREEHVHSAGNHQLRDRWNNETQSSEHEDLTSDHRQKQQDKKRADKRSDEHKERPRQSKENEDQSHRQGNDRSKEAKERNGRGDNKKGREDQVKSESDDRERPGRGNDRQNWMRGNGKER